MAAHQGASMRPQRATLRLIINSILLLLVVISWGWFIVSQVWPAARVEPWQRPAYWVGARLALEGKMELGYSDQEAFAQESVRLGAIPDILYPNFPTTVLPFMPLDITHGYMALWSFGG